MMNSYNSLFLAHDHAAALIGEADRERLARRAREARRAASGKGVQRPTTRWSLLSLRRSPAVSR